tara:strand:- start:1291 stop:1533 length:243 start_codon:yes stop_codon:yes gene_type:complete
MSDWGKGSINNNIGWGQGSDNTISWGAIYNISYSGDTNITGVLPLIEDIISDFKTRVALDFGSFEAEQSLRDFLINLNNK